MAFASHMNFQPRFDSGRPLDGDLVPVVPKPEPELSRKPDDGKARGLIARLSLSGFITALASRATDPIIPPIAHDIQVDPNAVDQGEGPYGAEGFVRQAVATLPKFHDNYAAIGSWIAGGKPCGLSVREELGPITRNTSRFLPHAIVG